MVTSRFSEVFSDWRQCGARVDIVVSSGGDVCRVALAGVLYRPGLFKHCLSVVLKLGGDGFIC